MRRTIVLFALSLAAGAGPQQNNNAGFYRAASTARMEARLRQIYAGNDWKADPNKPAERTGYYRALLTQHLTPSQEITVRVELAKELLRAGDSAASVDMLEQTARFIRDKSLQVPGAVDRDLHKTLAIAYLRLGEQENCLQMHGQKSCIFPIRGSGVHKATRGAQGAVRELTALLDADPADDISRWLLNIAYMQLGEYPAQVPKQWLVPESRFASEYDIHPSPGRWKFTDITAQAHVDGPRESFATWFFDYDNDGWPDIFIAGYSTHSMNDVGAFEMGRPHHAELPRLYHNNRDGTFTDVTAAAHLDRVILTMGANFGDLDNDGWLDIYFGTGETAYEALLPNRMLRNREGREFQDVTTSGGFGHLQKGHGIAFADIENNGYEDVLEEMGGAFPGDTYQPVLYRNPGHGNHWITLELQGVQTNRAAFGARIALTFRDHNALRRVFRTVGYGSSFGGNPLRQHIGLGNADSIEKLEIFWPVSKTTQVFTSVPVDRAFQVKEGAGTLDLASYKSFAFPVTKP